MATTAEDDAPPLTRGAARLATWMKEDRRSQQWVADQVETHQTNVSAWLKGRPIPLEKAIAVHKLTGIPVEYWAEANEQECPRPRRRRTATKTA